MAYNIGEKPGKGRCCCTKCSWSAVLDDDDDRRSVLVARQRT